MPRLLVREVNKPNVTALLDSGLSCKCHINHIVTKKIAVWELFPTLLLAIRKKRALPLILPSLDYAVVVNRIE